MIKVLKAIKEIYRHVIRPSEFDTKNKALPDEHKFGWNMIKEDCTKKEYAKQFTVFHHKFKYRFIVPVIIICQKLLGKYLVKKLPDRKYNEQFQCMDKAYEQTIKDMMYLHYQYIEDIKNKKYTEVDKRKLEDNVKNHLTAKNLRTIKEIILTVIQNDTWYRNFGTMFLYNLYKDLHVFFGKNKEIMLYSSKAINDVKFKVAVGHNSDSIIIQGDNNETLIIPKANAVILKDFHYVGPDEEIVKKKKK